MIKQRSENEDQTSTKGKIYDDQNKTKTNIKKKTAKKKKGGGDRTGREEEREAQGTVGVKEKKAPLLQAVAEGIDGLSGGLVPLLELRHRHRPPILLEPTPP